MIKNKTDEYLYVGWLHIERVTLIGRLSKDIKNVECYLYPQTQ